MKISCEEASHICNKSQYKEASFWDIVKLRFHLWYCKTCKTYSKKNSKLTSLCDRAGLSTLSEHDKECMKRDLEKRL
ncbi:hypothetical protein D2V93_10470 [Flagellimonas taeanensis]|uniref:hypothetical protein n=1 Tax=Flavobacteriaceae TaxID=49546 RepID=UPI000E690073|nr:MULTISPECIES: hypothetical protein [Allomuricauda]MDC6385959.1 hypothetical protein [Muricauda sp. SK9]RIV50203.1 hypothetical protein D2V93_10470 [Allomuricauda taeanensis]